MGSNRRAGRAPRAARLAGFPWGPGLGPGHDNGRDPGRPAMAVGWGAGRGPGRGLGGRGAGVCQGLAEAGRGRQRLSRRLSSAGSWIGSAGQLRRARGVPRAQGRAGERPRADSDGLRLGGPRRADSGSAGRARRYPGSPPHTSRVRLFASGGAQHGRRCAVCMPAAGRRRVAVTAVCAGLQHLLHRQEWCLV
jgi:hypothetical protein